MQPPLYGFHGVDCMQLCHYDRLHCDGKGILELLLKEVQSICSREQRLRIAARVAALHLPGLPNNGLDNVGHRITASELVLLALASLVPVADCFPQAGRAIASESQPCAWRPDHACAAFTKQCCHAPASSTMLVG